MFRPIALHNAAISAPRVAARPVPRAAFHAQARVTSSKPKCQAFRKYSSDSNKGSLTSGLTGGQGLVLGAIALIAIGGYFFMKPVRETAKRIDAAEKAADEENRKMKKANKQAREAAEKVGIPIQDVDAFDGLIGSLLPASVFVIYQDFSDQLKSTDFGGVLSDLEDSDMQNTLDQLKKLGNDDVNKVVDKVQASLNKAGGKVSQMDWQKLSKDLTQDLAEDYHKWVESLVGKVPDMKDFDKYLDDVKKVSEQQLDELNKAADKVYDKVQAARKKGASVGDAFVTGIKETAPEDLKKLVEQMRKTAKAAGLPAEDIEKYIRNATVDSIDMAEKWAQDIEKAISDTAKWMPVDSDVVTDKVSSVSPSLGKLFDEAVKDANNKLEEHKKISEEAAKHKK